MLLRSFKRKRDCATALVELLITFPVALTIVLASIHLSDVIRESSVVIEAARHGARSVSAASAIPTNLGLPPWAIGGDSTAIFSDCSNQPSATTGTGVAHLSACNFLSKYFGDAKWVSEKNKWEVSSQIRTGTEDIGLNAFNFRYISVTLRPKPETYRGLVDFYIPFINLNPQSTAVFPIMQVGTPS